MPPPSNLWDRIRSGLRSLLRIQRQLEPFMEAKDKAEEIVGLFDQALNTASSGRLAFGQRA